MEERKERYYVAEGRAHDYLLRCKDCKGLVTFAALTKLGACECGNKRCPHATDHRHACTGSNEPGQPGSVYA